GSRARALLGHGADCRRGKEGNPAAALSLRAIRARRARDVLIVGGEDHKTGQAKDCAQRFVNLERWARARFPFVAEVTDRWSGQVMEPLDGWRISAATPATRTPM